MNTDFVLVRGWETVWFWHGLRGWCTALDGATTYQGWEAAEKAISRRQKQGKWGNVGYMTVGEAREMLKEGTREKSGR